MKKFISIPNALIDQKDIDPATTFLYVVTKLNYNFKLKFTSIKTKTLMSNLNWKKTYTLKNHLQILNVNGFIRCDYEKLPRFEDLIIQFPVMKKNYTKLDVETAFELLRNENIANKKNAIRLYLLYKCYFHNEYQYCWLSYADIKQRMKIGESSISHLNKTLREQKFIQITKGNLMINENSSEKSPKFYKERNKYKIVTK